MRDNEGANLRIRAQLPELHLRVSVLCRDTCINRNAAFCGLWHRGVAFKKTNVFLIPPAYTKTPHECKGLRGCFERGFFEGSIAVLNILEMDYNIRRYSACFSESSIVVDY